MILNITYRFPAPIRSASRPRSAKIAEAQSRASIAALATRHITSVSSAGSIKFPTTLSNPTLLLLASPHNGKQRRAASRRRSPRSPTADVRDRCPPLEEASEVGIEVEAAAAEESFWERSPTNSRRFRHPAGSFPDS